MPIAPARKGVRPDTPRKTGEPWRVGVLFSHSGFMSVIEETQLHGTLLAIEEINASGGVNGRELIPVIYDPASESAAFGHYAKRLMIEDRITTIFGCYTSSSRKAVLPVVERLNGLLWYPTLYEGFEYSPNIIYTGSSPNQNTVALINYLVATHGNRFYLIGTDYCYPRRTNRIVRDLVCGQGGSIVAEEYLDFDAGPNDIRPIINALRDRKPDVIFSTVVGSGTSNFYRAYRAAGFDPTSLPIASLTTSEAEVAEIGTEAAEGHITAAPFFETLSSPAAKRFVGSFKDRYGADAPVTAAAEAAYFQVHLAMRAVAKCGSDDPDQVLINLRDAELDAPQGRVRIDSETNHTWLWPRIARIDRQGRFQVVWNPGVRIKPDPYCVVQSLDDWSVDDVPLLRS